MMTTTMIFEVTGRDLLTFKRDAWEGIVGQVGGVLINLPLRYRWITIARPATLQSMRSSLEDDLAFAESNDERERIQAQILHIADLTQEGMQDIRHFLILWDVADRIQQTLLPLLQSVFGRVMQRTTFPKLWSSSKYYGDPCGLIADDGSHVWRGGLNGTLQGAITPDVWMPILKQPFPTMIMIDVHTFSQGEASRKMDDAKMQMEAHAVGQRGYHEGRQSRLRDWQRASKVLNDSAQLSEIQIGVWVQGSTRDEANHRFHVTRDRLSTWLPLRSCYGRQAEIAHFLSLLPESEIVTKKVVHPAVTGQVATVLPWAMPQNSVDPQGVYLGYDLVRRMMFQMPLASVAAMHACIFGMTGMGKTTLAIMWLFRLIKGFHFQGIVLDPQNAFSDLAKVFPDGSYNRVTLRHHEGHRPMHINVLDPIVDNLGDELFAQTVHVMNVLQLILKVEFTVLQRQQLSQALAHLYTGLGIVTVHDRTNAPLLVDLVQTLDVLDPNDTTGVTAMIRMLTQAPFASIYNHPTTLDLRLDPATPLIVYDFDVAMPEEQKVIFLTLIMSAIQREVRRNPRRGILILDEAGMMFKTSIIANFAEEFASTLRRFGLGFWMIDQLLDLLTTSQGRRVFKNAFITALGCLKTDERPTLEQFFPMLTHEQITSILALDKTMEELRRTNTGKFALIVNTQVYSIMNRMTTYEQGLMPRSAVV